MPKFSFELYVCPIVNKANLASKNYFMIEIL